jgi:fatty-acyl-CoA synthase
MNSPRTTPPPTGADGRSDWRTADSEVLLEDSIPEILARQLASGPGRPALLWPDGDRFERMTFAELAAAANAVAHALAAITEPGARVAIWSRNSVEWVLLHYACALAGRIAAPFNTAWTDPEVRYAAELITPAVVFTGLDRDGHDTTARARELCPGIPVLELAALREWAWAAPTAALPRVRATDPLLIQFTSGTTGRFKAALLSQRALVNAAAIRASHDVLGPDDVWLNPVPYHHIGGFCHVVLGGLVNGGGIVVIDRFSASEMVRLIGLGGVTRIGGVPTMVNDIVDRVREAGHSAALTSVSTGGATVTQHLVDKVRAAFGAVVVSCYGQSECPTVTHTEPDTDPATLAASIGRPVAGTRIRIVDPASGAVVPFGAVGEIQVQSPCAMDRYWGMPEATREVLGPDGFLHTGDLGTMSADGYVAFSGRDRDVIIRGGENIYPVEIEEVLVAHPGIADVVLVGLDDERLGERVAGAVIRAPGSTVTAGELTDYLRDKVAYFKIPSAWWFTDAFPTTASGKVQRFRIRAAVNAELGERGVRA